MSPKTITSHGVPRQIPGRGPNGRRFCRWCHSEVPKGRSSYCDNECRKHADFNYSKILCVHRDERKCRFCSVAGRYHYWPRDRELPKLEVDHIVAVKDGGSHHPDNLRTLCRDCHKVRTKEQRSKGKVQSEETYTREVDEAAGALRAEPTTRTMPDWIPSEDGPAIHAAI